MDQTRRIIVSDIEIRESVVGTGPPVLMIHGWGANSDLLQPLAKRLVRFGYQLFMPDLPGFGESAEPKAPLSIHDYAEFCRNYMDYHGLDSVCFFGHSLGGRIGLILGSDYHTRIHAMVLSNSAGIKMRQSPTRQLRLKFYKSIREGLARLGAYSTAQHLQQMYNRTFGSADFQAASPVMRETLIKVVNQDLLEQARRISVPTVLIWGDSDQETPLWMGEKLERTIPDAALIVHAGAGHYAYLEKPEKTASIMHALFQSQLK